MLRLCRFKGRIRRRVRRQGQRRPRHQLLLRHQRERQHGGRWQERWRSTAYAGITPIGLDEKYNASSYPSFDFTNTWSIAEGVDEPRLVPLTSFTDFLDGCHLPLNTKPGADVNGIPAGARYVFGINPATGPADFAKPLLDIGFDSDGKPYVKLPALANTDGATVTVLATEDLADWFGAKLVKMVRDDADGTWHTADDSHLPQMFFKWCVDIPRAEE